MKRGGPIKRETPLAKVNQKRKAAAFERAYESPARVKWVNMQPCVVCGGWPCEAAHVTSKAAGGTADDLVALCARHHRLQHDMGIETFQAEYRVDLEGAAEALAIKWRATQR